MAAGHLMSLAKRACGMVQLAAGVLWIDSATYRFLEALNKHRPCKCLSKNTQEQQRVILTAGQEKFILLFLACYLCCVFSGSQFDQV